MVLRSAPPSSAFQFWARRPMLSHCVSQQASVCFTTANAVVNGRQSHSRRLDKLAAVRVGRRPRGANATWTARIDRS